MNTWCNGATLAYVSDLDDVEVYETGPRQPGQRFYGVRAEAARWSLRTGRPLLQWLWDDDLDTRLPGETT